MQNAKRKNAMKNKLMTREAFDEYTENLGNDLIALANRNGLSDDTVYDMVTLLLTSYVNAVRPVKEEN